MEAFKETYSCGFLGLVSVAVAGTGYSATLHNDVVPVYWAAIKEVNQAVPHAVGVALLGLQRGSGYMGRHGVIGHLAPGMIDWSWLGIPNVASVSSQVAGFQHLHQGVGLH